MNLSTVTNKDLSEKLDHTECQTLPRKNPRYCFVIGTFQTDVCTWLDTICRSQRSETMFSLFEILHPIVGHAGYLWIQPRPRAKFSRTRVSTSPTYTQHSFAIEIKYGDTRPVAFCLCSSNLLSVGTATRSLRTFFSDVPTWNELCLHTIWPRTRL